MLPVLQGLEYWSFGSENFVHLWVKILEHVETNSPHSITALPIQLSPGNSWKNDTNYGSQDQKKNYTLYYKWASSSRTPPFTYAPRRTFCASSVEKYLLSRFLLNSKILFFFTQPYWPTELYLWFGDDFNLFSVMTRSNIEWFQNLTANNFQRKQPYKMPVVRSRKPALISSGDCIPTHRNIHGSQIRGSLHENRPILKHCMFPRDFSERKFTFELRVIPSNQTTGGRAHVNIIKWAWGLIRLQAAGQFFGFRSS